MSLFGFYFVTSLLREMGWPRKQGLFRRVAIDSTVADGAIDQMVNWAASLGAGRPPASLLARDMILSPDANRSIPSVLTATAIA